MTVVAWVCAALLAAAAAMALVRVERGPSMLDRTIALDTLTAVLVAGIGVHAAWTRRTDTVPIIVAMSLIGFVGSAAIARFAAVEPEGEGRVLTREEAVALSAQGPDGPDLEPPAHEELAAGPDVPGEPTPGEPTPGEPTDDEPPPGEPTDDEEAGR